MIPALLAPTKQQIERLESELLAMPQVDLGTTHSISGGVYARTIFIPAGTALTGATHKKDHINVLQGSITVWTEDGMKRLDGHHVLPTKAGAKRAGYAHSDTWWTTLCATEQTDIEAIENELVEEADRLQTRQPVLTVEETPCLSD